MSKKLGLFLLKNIIWIHNSIVFVGILGLILIFLKPFQLFFIFFYLIVVGSEIIFFANCPLTIYENKLRTRLNLKKNEDIHVNVFLKNYLNLKLPENLVKYVLIIYFIISLLLLFK